MYLCQGFSSLIPGVLGKLSKNGAGAWASKGSLGAGEAPGRLISSLPFQQVRAKAKRREGGKTGSGWRAGRGPASSRSLFCSSGSGSRPCFYCSILGCIAASHSLRPSLYCRLTINPRSALRLKPRLDFSVIARQRMCESAVRRRLHSRFVYTSVNVKRSG